MENNVKRTPKRPSSAVNNNRLMLGETKRVTEPFMSRIKPYGVPQEKEKMYEEINKIRLLNNCLKEDLTQHKARIRQHLQDLNSRDDLIMQLTGKFDKAGYERVHLVAELSKANRLLQMQLESNISELEDIKRRKPTRKTIDLEEDVKNKNEIIQKLTDENKNLNEEKAELRREIYDLKEKIRELQEDIKGMVLKNEHDLKISDFIKKLREKDEEISKLREEKNKILKDVDEYKARCGEHEKKNDKLVEQIKSAEKLINELKAKIKSMTENEDKLNRELAEKQKDLSGKVPKSELDKLNAMINEYEKNEKKFKDTIDDLNKKLKEAYEKLKNFENNFKNSEENYKNLIQDLNKQIKDLKENKQSYEKSIVYPFTLPRHLQYFLICLQVARIKSKELRDNIFENLPEDSLVSRDSLHACFKKLSYKISMDFNISTLIIDDIIINQDKQTPKAVINYLLNKLGDYEVQDKDDKDKYEKHLLRLLAMNYNELFQKCRSFDTNLKGTITIYEFYSSCIMSGTYLDKPVWIYLLILLHIRDRQFDDINYESFLCDFLQNIEKLKKDDEKSIAISYFEKIAEIGIKQKFKLSKLFYIDKKIISPTEFKNSCLDIKLYLELPLIVIMMKHYGTNKDNNYSLKKSEFLDILKKFKYTEDDSSSCSSKSKSSDKKSKVSALPISNIITNPVSIEVPEDKEQKSVDKLSSSSSKSSAPSKKSKQKSDRDEFKNTFTSLDEYKTIEKKHQKHLKNKLSLEKSLDSSSKRKNNKEEKKISDNSHSSRSNSSSIEASGTSKDFKGKVDFPSSFKLKDSTEFQDSDSKSSVQKKSSKRLSSDLKAKIPKKDDSSKKLNLNDISNSNSSKKKFKMPKFEEKKDFADNQAKPSKSNSSSSSKSLKKSSSKEDSSEKSVPAISEDAKIKFNIPQFNEIKGSEIFKSSNPSLPESSRYNKEIEFDKTNTKVVEIPNQLSKKSSPSVSSSSSKEENDSATSEVSYESSESSSKNKSNQPPVVMPPPKFEPFNPTTIIKSPPKMPIPQTPPTNSNKLPVSLPSLKVTSKSESSDSYDSDEEDSKSDDSNSNQSESEENSSNSDSINTSKTGNNKKSSKKSSSGSDVTPSASGSSEVSSSNSPYSDSYSSQSSSSRKKAKIEKNKNKSKKS